MRQKKLIPFLIAAATLSANGALVGYWNFDNSDLDESSGFTANGTHDGVEVGTVAYSSGPAGFGNALDLRGGNNAVQVLNSNEQTGGGGGGGINADYASTFDVNLGNAMTIAMWVQGLPNGNWKPYISKKGETDHGYQVRRYSSGQNLSFTLRGATADRPDDADGGSTTWNTGGWHHLAAVWDKATGNRLLYIDGVLDGSSITDGSDTDDIGIPANEYLMFGARDNGGIEAFSGVQLDEIRIYNNALSQTEVQALMAVPEPSSAGLLGLGGLALILRRRR